MDNIKSLLDDKQYDLVIKITNNALEPKMLYYRIAAFMALNQIDNALITINEHQKLLESNLKLLMPLHIELLCLKKSYDDANKTLDYYEGLPYQSQEVEELFKKLRDFVAKSRNKFTNTMMDDDQLLDALNSSDNDLIIAALDALKYRNITPYINELERILISYPKQSVRSFALMLLVNAHYSKEVEYKSYNKMMHLNPSTLEPPFLGNDFNKFALRIATTFKDPTLSDSAISILSSYIIYIYPNKIDYDDKLLKALDYVSRSYMQMKLPDIEHDVKLIVDNIKGIEHDF